MEILPEDIIPSINDSLGIELHEKISYEKLKEAIAAYVHSLIEKDFNKLISLLYRLDINEGKLRLLLHNHSEVNAGNIIAEMIIERQVQKIKSRREFKQRDDTINDDEKW
jgi:hypothetical protein